MAHTRTKRFYIRPTAWQEALIRHAASQTDRSVSEFILSSATAEAEKMLADQRQFAVADEQFESVQEILNTPLTNIDRFVHLWDRPSPFGTRIDLSEDA